MTEQPREVRLRPVTGEDQEFLIALYATTRAEDLALMGLSEEQARQFVLMQYNAQQSYYKNEYEGAEFDIVLHNDKPAGRLYAERGTDKILLVDISLLPELRGTGVARVVMDSLMDEANAAGIPLQTHVLKSNKAAMRFYDKLGFRIIKETEVHKLLEWRAQT